MSENASLPESGWMIPVAEAQVVTTSTPDATGLPARIIIPSIRVNALITDVGLMPNGSMGVPKRPRDTGWYSLGPRPGQTGSSVIAGHVNWWNGAKGVFQNLQKLKKDDVITVQDNQGVKTTFIVRAIRVFGSNEDATDVFYSNDGKAHLNLVTCAGIWDRVAGMYTKRLVVFTEKLEK